MEDGGQGKGDLGRIYPAVRKGNPFVRDKYPLRTGQVTHSYG